MCTKSQLQLWNIRVSLEEETQGAHNSRSPEVPHNSETTCWAAEPSLSSSLPLLSGVEASLGG